MKIESFSFAPLFWLFLLLSHDPALAAERRSDLVPPGDHRFSLKHGHLTRLYLVHVPPGYDSQRPLPVLIALHGGGGSCDTAPDYFQINPKSDEEGFIVVYPQGTGHKVAGKTIGSWNAGKCCPPANKNQIDDVGFIRAMIERLKKDFAVDEKRVYATGMSNGALMSYRLACDLADIIAAIAPVGAHDATDESCLPSRPVPVIHFHGTADPCALYNGGGNCGGCFLDFTRGLLGLPPKRSELWTCGSVKDYVEQWAERNACAATTETTYMQGAANCSTYQGCYAGADVTLCTIEGMGHTWPGQIDHGIKACEKKPDGKICRLWEKTVGPMNHDMNANDVMWDFFLQHPMP